MALSADRPLRVLTFGTLYPDATRPQHGIFVERRLRELLKAGDVAARVVAPVPWFPSAHPLFGEWASFSRVARREVRHDIIVDHPRFPVLPAIGMNVAPWLLAAGALRSLARVRREGFDFDVIDAQYFYPDGIAAVLLGQWLGCPVTITARGSDLNVIAGFRWPRRQIRRAAQRAAACITVSGALASQLDTLGVPRRSVHVLRNGVDLEAFAPPADRAARRAALGVEGYTLLSVGNLVPLKGHDLVLRALAELPDTALAVAGAGPAEGALRRLAHDLGVQSRVRFLGRIPQAQLRDWYGAADALVLASHSEGMANVLLESMACGTPVVATGVGGTPEVICAPAAGVLVGERSPAGLAEAVRRLRSAPPARNETRRHAERYGWGETAAGLLAVLRDAAARGHR